MIHFVFQSTNKVKRTWGFTGSTNKVKTNIDPKPLLEHRDSVGGSNA